MQDDSWDKGPLARWLNDTEPFSELPPAALQQLLDVSVECEYQPGEVILRQRSQAHPFLGGVISGEVRLFDDVTHLLEVPCLPGELFGASGLLKGGPLPYHAIASMRSTCVRIPAPIIRQLCDTHEAFAAYMVTKFLDIPNLPEVGAWVGGALARPYASISSMESARGWGDVLAVGMGDVAISWLLQQPEARWTVVSKTPEESEKYQQVYGKQRREKDRFVTASWEAEDFLEQDGFDVTIADYRYGAIDAASPRLQAGILSRLRKLTKHRLYLLGHEPVDTENESLGGQILQEVMRLRDVCLTLAFHHPHLVYSSHEARYALDEAGLVVEGIAHFPRQFGIASIHAMLNECLLALPAIQDTQLSLALASSIRDLREKALAVSDFQWGIRHSSDFLIAARPA